ncbi:2-phospho-L-lactate guanylyltransferase [Halomonas sp. THAF5a]|uniref:TIGR04282 family arsenosugar biosynthesis glycosyltransferase n=1 Tax=Halomonas sp. THAF5a TaxID=2587844 RepID=UPI0012692AEA|nr:TIGR04282 family arsenosugar biosynthesis glycosyltransferase [Halomonas sp. THAF5a]QFU02731.1 2-phospho-L-lactate guanylyltransferase [Halomonas sp. THAF5a]
MCADPRDASLAILAKAPIPGRAKTRLIPALGAEDASRLHAGLLRHAVATALAASEPSRITLWTALEHDHPLFRELAERHGIALGAQPEGDLGARMHHALAAMGAPGLVIGSDCPALTPALLRRCAAALIEADGVCVPVEDGGYALVGARRAEPGLFQGIDWGMDRVMAQTRERAMAMGWRLACPARLWDVDRPEDLPRLARLGEALGVDFLAPRHQGHHDSRPAL